MRHASSTIATRIRRAGIAGTAIAGLLVGGCASTSTGPVARESGAVGHVSSGATNIPGAKPIWTPGRGGLVTHSMAGVGGPHTSRRDASLGYPAPVIRPQGVVVTDRIDRFTTTARGDVRSSSRVRIRERSVRPAGG